VPGSGSGYFQSLDPDPDSDPYFDPDPSAFFHVKNTNFWKTQALAPDQDSTISQAQDPDPQIFETLDPDLHEMHADPKPWVKF